MRWMRCMMDGWMSGYMDGRMDGSATLKTRKRPRLLDYDCREKRPGGRDSALDRRSGRPAPRAPLTELRGLEKTPPPTGAHAPPSLSGVAFVRPTFTASRTATSGRQTPLRATRRRWQAPLQKSITKWYKLTKQPFPHSGMHPRAAAS